MPGGQRPACEEAVLTTCTQRAVAVTGHWARVGSAASPGVRQVTLQLAPFNRLT